MDNRPDQNPFTGHLYPPQGTFSPYTDHRLKIKAHIEDVNGVPFEKKVHEKSLQIYANRERYNRVELVMGLLRVRASYGDHITYGELMALIQMTSFYELLHILRLVTLLCIENNWPVYTALILDKDGKVGKGFYKAYFKAKGEEPVEFTPETSDYLEALELSLVYRCFNEAPPFGVSYATAMAHFAAKHKL